MTADDVIEELRAACKEAGSIRAWAARAGVSATYVSDILRKKREPAGRVLDEMRIERVVETRVSYRRKKR